MRFSRLRKRFDPLQSNAEGRVLSSLTPSHARAAIIIRSNRFTSLASISHHNSFLSVALFSHLQLFHVKIFTIFLETHQKNRCENLRLHANDRDDDDFFLPFSARSHQYTRANLLTSHAVSSFALTHDDSFSLLTDGGKKQEAHFGEALGIAPGIAWHVSGR